METTTQILVVRGFSYVCFLFIFNCQFLLVTFNTCPPVPKAMPLKAQRTAPGPTSAAAVALTVRAGLSPGPADGPGPHSGGLGGAVVPSVGAGGPQRAQHMGGECQCF